MQRETSCSGFTCRAEDESPFKAVLRRLCDAIPALQVLEWSWNAPSLKADSSQLCDSIPAATEAAYEELELCTYIAVAEPPVD